MFYSEIFLQWFYRCYLIACFLFSFPIHTGSCLIFIPPQWIFLWHLFYFLIQDLFVVAAKKIYYKSLRFITSVCGSTQALGFNSHSSLLSLCPFSLVDWIQFALSSCCQESCRIWSCQYDQSCPKSYIDVKILYFLLSTFCLTSVSWLFNFLHQYRN